MQRVHKISSYLSLNIQSLLLVSKDVEGKSSSLSFEAFFKALLHYIINSASVVQKMVSIMLSTG